jgi:hypothetical protein
MGEAIAAEGVKIDRAICSGLVRTRATAQQVLAAMTEAPALEQWPELQEIRPGHLVSIPDAELRSAFIAAFEGPVPRDARFLKGETIGELLDRTLPALQRLLGRIVGYRAAGIVALNRGLLSWFLTGEPVFLSSPGRLPQYHRRGAEARDQCRARRQLLRFRHPADVVPAVHNGAPARPVHEAARTTQGNGRFHMTQLGDVTERHRFDVERLIAHLEQHLSEFRGPIEVSQFQGGQSNPTYLLTTSWVRDAQQTGPGRSCCRRRTRSSASST